MTSAENDSPYAGLSVSAWHSRTLSLIASFPVPQEEIVEIVLEQWTSIFRSRVGKHGLRIGKHIYPKPQIMGDYLHELIPYEFQARFGADTWRRDKSGKDKDLVNVKDDFYSTEIKTSSHKNRVFGNRSYAQPGVSRKTKSGFYLTVNFQKWSEVVEGQYPNISVVRLGWLDHTDWKAQRAQTGQQARILPDAYAGKLIELYRA